MDESFHLTKDKEAILKNLGQKIIRFARHHFRADPAKASSFFLEDQVLIDARSHPYFESILSEDEVLVYIDVLESLIKKKGPIDETNIMSEFKKHGNQYLWLADNWFNDKDFGENLKTFNERKDEIKAMRLDEWIESKYPIAYGRFYENILKDKRLNICSLISKLHPNLDISALVNLKQDNDYIKEFTRIFIEIMNQYAYPIKF